MKSLAKRARWAMLVPALLVASFAIVACGDDGGGGGEASDEEYVRNICAAEADLIDALFGDLLALMFEAEEGDEEAEQELMDRAASIFEDFTDDIRNIGTPPDVREHHDELVAELDSVVERLEAGDINALEEGSDEPEFPEDVRERLSAVAQDVDDCAETALF